MERPDWAPADVDITRPSIARVYDYWVGGTHNFPVDREVARRVEEGNPILPQTFRANRRFLQRVVRHLCDAGIQQFLDIGSGIPTQGNVHEIAIDRNPKARVVYVDIDPVAVSHGTAILAGEDRAVSLQADLFDMDAILETDQTRRLIDFSQPVALILAAVLHFVPDEAEPGAVVARYAARLAPGSHVVITHAGRAEVPAVAPPIAGSYRGSVNEVIWRNQQQTTELFGDLELVPPGVVPVPLWRPEPGGDSDGLGADAPMWAGAARKA